MLEPPRGSNAGVQGTIGFRKNREQKHPVDASMLRASTLVHPDWNYKVDRSAKLRAVVPKELCLEIIQECEKTLKTEPLLPMEKL